MSESALDLEEYQLAACKSKYSNNNYFTIIILFNNEALLLSNK